MIHTDPIDPNEWRAESSTRHAPSKRSHQFVKVLGLWYCPVCTVTYSDTRQGVYYARGESQFDYAKELPTCTRYQSKRGQK